MKKSLKLSLKQWGWMAVIWLGSVMFLTLISYLIRFTLK
ncbi:DUF2474 family protein [uncultured Psychromonas sp.]|nr:DUF2474 family protein [uncultured Psychromonas sp.]